jgi:hypothetical protein
MECVVYYPVSVSEFADEMGIGEAFFNGEVIGIEIERTDKNKYNVNGKVVDLEYLKMYDKYDIIEVVEI